MSYPKLVKPGEGMAASWANDVVYSLRSLSKGRKKRKTLFIGDSSSGGEDVCSFGTIVKSTSGTYIKGGMIYCGDKNFNVPDHQLSLAGSSTKLYYFEIPCESNRDDDNEIILPNIKTSTWSVSWESTASESYPDNTNPVVETGIGTVIIPVGQVVIGGGKATLTAVACGNATVTQCGGTLGHTRG